LYCVCLAPSISPARNWLRIFTYSAHIRLYVEPIPASAPIERPQIIISSGPLITLISPPLSSLILLME
jgi:hypothetical protein